MMKFNIKRLVALLCAVGILMLAGCADKTPQVGETEDLSDTYAFVGKNIQNPYMQRMYEGFEAACSEIGVKSVFRAPEAITSRKQIEIINSLIESNMAGIAVAANDADALLDVLQDAMDKGIKIISLDSAVVKDARQTHIQQADPEVVGRELIRAAYDITGGTGGIAILSSTATATNQNLWIEYMKKELEEDSEKYANMPLIDIVYGDDDLTKSISETERILPNKDIKVIVAPTAVGIQGAAMAIKDKNSDVKLTGLGMPSQMAGFIDDNVCQVMYLWNPVDIGYLAGYTIDALAKGSITGAVQETFAVGSLGSRTIVEAADGGTEVMLGDLLKFDKSNIAEWKDAY